MLWQESWPTNRNPHDLSLGSSQDVQVRYAVGYRQLGEARTTTYAPPSILRQFFQYNHSI